MKSLYSFFLIFIINSIIIGCSKDGGTSPELIENVIVPLKVGNSWNFSDGSKLVVNSSTTFNGHKVYAMNYYSSNGSVDDIGFWANFEDGLYIKKRDSLKLWLKYPGNVGDKYNITEHGYHEIRSNSKNITVPAGDFSACYEYIHYDDGYLVETFIFKPEVGPVIMGKNVELISYSLK